MCIYIYIYIYMYGTDGVSANGFTANVMSFDRGTFWVLPLTYFYIPQSAREYLFPQSVKIHYFCSGPISVDPIRPQPNTTALAEGGGWRGVGFFQGLPCLRKVFGLLLTMGEWRRFCDDHALSRPRPEAVK